MDNKLKSDSTKNNSPIFVIGTPRSGTTLTAKILGKHSRLFMPGETHYFDDIFQRREDLGSLNNSSNLHSVADRLYTIYERYYELPDQELIDKLFPDLDDLVKVLAGSENYCEILTRFMEVQKKNVGKQRWGNNVPRDIFNVQDIINCFPDAVFIICVRDVRAFLYSYQGKWKVTGDMYVGRIRKMYHPVVTSYLWKASMKQLAVLKNILPENKYMVVCYEELVTNPESIVKNMCEFLGEEYEPVMLDIDSHNSSNMTESKGIFSASVNRWKNLLTPEEIFIGQKIANPELELLSYKEISVKVNYIKVLWIYFTTPFALWRALSANKKIRGPLMPYLIKRFKVILAKSS